MGSDDRIFGISTRGARKATWTMAKLAICTAVGLAALTVLPFPVTCGIVGVGLWYLFARLWTESEPSDG